ncbi:hypothetical protein BC830DRAFT_1124579, partial [Chytriomyces sp. MP71]
MEQPPSVPAPASVVSGHMKSGNGGALLEVVGDECWDNVYQNGLHALRWLHLRNASAQRLLVRIKSTLGSQLAFQLTNENLPPSNDSPFEPRLIHRHHHHPYNLKYSHEASFSSSSGSSSTRELVGQNMEKDDSAAADTPLALVPAQNRAQMLSSETWDVVEIAQRDAHDASDADDDPDLSAATPQPNISGANVLRHPHPYMHMNQLSMMSLASVSTADSFYNTPDEFDSTPTSPRSAPRISQPFGADNIQTDAGGTVLSMRQSLISSNLSESPPQDHGPHTKPSSFSHQFNQLFNYVNYIDQIEMEPGQILKVVMAFLPDDGHVANSPNSVDRSPSPDFRAKGTLSMDDHMSVSQPTSHDAPPILHSLDGGEELHDFFEINGLIFFFAFVKSPTFDGYSLDSLEMTTPRPFPGTDLTTPRPSFEPLSPPLSHTQSILPPPILTSSIVEPIMLSPTALSSSTSSAHTGRDYGSPDYQVTLKFRSRVCRSVLWTDIGETGISFDACVVGGTYFKDFSIWNKSEIDLYWVLNTIDLSNRQNNSWLSFSEYDTGEPLDFSRPIPSYSQHRIRVTFKPTEAGEFSYDLQMENSNDSARNTVQALLHADVKSAPTEEVLRVGNNGVVDFGDCYTGLLYKQQIAIKNLADVPVDIALTVEDDADIVFQLKASDRHRNHYPQPARNNAALDDTDDTHRFSTSNSIGSRGRLGDEMGSKPVLRAGRIRELVGTGVGIGGVSGESASMSDLSNPSSGLHSRSSSPVTLHRLNSDTMTVGSSVDLSEFMSQSRRGDDSSSIGIGDVDDLGIYGSSFGTVNSDKRLLKDDDVTRIEELVMRAGTERVVEFCFRPNKDRSGGESSLHAAGVSSGKLAKRNFRVVLSYVKQGSNEKERKIIQCKARICTSVIEVHPKELNFGDTDVGTLKSLPVTVSNMSDLSAKIEVQFTSKVLHCYKGELVIPPRQSIEVKMDIYPRKVNPDYSKQITIVNLNNRENDQIVEVKSTHIDKNRVTFHSLFYRILTPTSANFLDFGSVVFGAPTVRTFSIENTSKKHLILELSSSMPDEIQIYTKAGPSRLSTFSQNVSNIDSRALKEHLIESVVARRPGGKKGNDSVTNAIDDADTDSIASPTTNATSSISRVASLIAVQRSFESPADVSDAEKAEYLDLALPGGHGKEARSSPKRKIATAAVASFSEALKHLRDQYNRDRQVGVGTSTSAEEDGRDSGPVDSVNLPEATDPSRLQVSATGSQAIRKALAKARDDVPGPPKLNVDAFLKSIEEFTGIIPPLFPKQASEEKYVKAYQLLQRELVTLVKDERLVRVNLVDIEPGSEVSLVVVMTAQGSRRPFVQTKAKKHDAKLFLKIVEFDREIHQPQFEQLLTGDKSLIPVRELMIRSSLCRSVMELGQRNINFGYLDKNEPQTKTIVIRNKSETPLLYYVRKSGLISSGDLTILDGRIGLIRGYGKKEIDFVFNPSLAGLYQEKLIVENIQDRGNDQTLTIKAHIRQPSKFSIEPVELDFGPCLINEFSANIQQIIVSNTSSKPRTFEIRVDDEKLEFKSVSFDVRLEALGGANDGVVAVDERGKKKQSLSKEVLEKIEELEQKIKIYNRKGKLEKAEKALGKLEKLRAGITEDDIGKSKDDGDSKVTSITSSDSKDSGEGTLDSSPTIPPLGRSKYVARALIVSVEARSSKTIAVHVKPFRKNSLMATALPFDTDSEVCHSSILVNEFKNTDVVKSITFRSVICFDPARFRDLLAAEGLSFLSQNPINSEIQPVSEMQKAAMTDFVDLLPVYNKPLFLLELSMIDLGRLEVSVVRDCYFTMFNQTDEKLNFEILFDGPNPCVVFKDLSGVLEARESRRVYLQLIPSQLGRQSHNFRVRSLYTMETVTFTFYSMLHSYLQFPAITESRPQLDLGPCYVSMGRKFARIEPFDVLNASDTSISVSATSNLTQQCFIFADQELEIPAVDLAMKPREKLTLYVALQPSVVKPSSGVPSFQAPLKSTIKSSTNLVSGGESITSEVTVIPQSSERVDMVALESSRTLIGGIRFAISTLTLSSNSSVENLLLAPFYLKTQTVKFSAVIGVSNFSVEESVVDLGITKTKVGKYTGKFTIMNRTPRLPLVFSVETTAPDVIRLEYCEGFIAAVDEDAVPGGTASLCVSFTISCTKWGYINERIIVRNSNNQSQAHYVEVRFFANAGLTSLHGINQYSPPKVLSSHESAYSKSSFESKSSNDLPRPVIWWDDIYVSVASDPPPDGGPQVQLQRKLNSEVVPAYEKSFDVINETDELLEIAARPSMNNNVRWVLNSGGGFVMNSNTDVAQTGSLLLQKHEKAALHVSVHAPPQNEDIARRLLTGKCVTIRGLLLLENPETSLTLNAIDLLACYGLSIGGLEPYFVDLGRVGHLNNWEDITFTFRVINQADCTLRYDLELPDMIEVIAISTDVGTVVTKRCIESGKFHNIDAILKPRRIPNKVGPHVSTIIVSNLYNPRNVMVLEVRSVLTLLDLKFERLVDGELILPPLIYPSVSSNHSCDSWFKIISKSEQDLKFEIEFDASPDLSDFVRLDIVSRSANSHLNGVITLEPFGSLDVRVRAFVQDGARLTSASEKSKFLTSSFGVTMGTLHITTKYAISGSSDKRMIHNIPLRCTIVEGPTFSVNERRIKFSCFPTDNAEHGAQLQVKQVTLINHSKFFPLNFRVAVDYPLEFPLGTNLVEITPLSCEHEGVIDPASQLTLSVTLLRSNIGGISDSVKLHIYDINSVSSYFQTVQISITEHNHTYNSNTLEALSMARHVDSERNDSLSEPAEAPERVLSEHDISAITEEPQSLADDGEASISDVVSFSASNPLSNLSGNVDKVYSQYSQSNRSNISETVSGRRIVAPLITLRGCKRVSEGNQQPSEPGGLFNMDLGQQDISTTIITKRIVLESIDRVSYKVRTLSDADRSWLLISRADGCLDARNSSHSINLNFLASTRGIYSTYVLVENIENPLDSKIIRTTMEVVGKHNLRRNPNLSLQPSSGTSLMPGVSQDITNVFDVIVAGLDPLASEGLSENVIIMDGLYYGTEYTARSIILQNHETVALEFFIKSNLKSADPTELIFSLSRSAAKVFRSVIVQPESYLRVFLRFTPSLGDAEMEKMDLATANNVDEKLIEISVNCRLVKDYQKTIYLKARCRKPQIHL